MSKLTNTEFDNAFDNALKAFSRVNKKEMIAELYGLRSETRPGTQNRMWLYLYALNTWDNTSIDDNLMTESQMLKLISKVQQNG